MNKTQKKKVIASLNKAMIYKTFNKAKDDERSIYTFNEKVINQEIRDILFKADFKIDDYHYRWLAYAFDSIREHLELNDDLKEFEIYEASNSSIDVYTGCLTEWLASNVERVYYLTEAIENDCKDGFQALQQAQSTEIQEVYNMALQVAEHLIEGVV